MSGKIREFCSGWVAAIRYNPKSTSCGVIFSLALATKFGIFVLVGTLIGRLILIAAIWSENSDFGQNSDQNHGKCSLGQKKVRISDRSQKFRKMLGKTPIFIEKIKF